MIAVNASALPRPWRPRHPARCLWQTSFGAREDELGVPLISTFDQAVERQIEALQRAGARMRSSVRRPVDGDGH